MTTQQKAFSFHRMMQCFWFITALACVLGFGFLYIHLLRPAQTEVTSTLSGKKIDSFLTNLSVKEFSKDGQLIHYLQTPLMQHHPKTNTNLLRKPHLIITENNQAPWEIRAEKARAKKDHTITLIHHVMIEQKASESKASTLLKTEKMIYFPKEKRASTTQKVTIQQAKNHMQAVGMNAYLDDNKVELLSHVRGRYEPKQTD